MTTTTKRAGSAEPHAKKLPPLPVFDVHRTSDFEPDGQGTFSGWESCEPAFLTHAGPGKITKDYSTWFKALWSEQGVYFFVHANDSVLTSTGLPDLAPLYTEDVIEVFLQPDEAFPLYLEYEVSPFGKELPLLIPNLNGNFRGWTPWLYESKSVRKAVAVYPPQKRASPVGAQRETVEPAPHMAISGWSAEFFIPLVLMAPMTNTVLKPGVTWRANIYRIDHDPPGRYSRFEWSPITAASFHDMSRFGTLRFVE